MTPTADRRSRVLRWGTAAAVVVVVLAACGSGERSSSTASTSPTPSASSATAASAPPTIAPAASATTDRDPVASRLDTPAVADERADRGLAAEDGATCDLALVESLAARHPGARQFVLVTPATWGATTAAVELAAFDGTRWVCQLSARTAMVGSAGTRPLLERRSGDGTTPAGVFPLGTQTAWDGQRFQFFGNAPDPGVRGAYRAVQPADCWGATPGAATYQRLYQQANCPGPDDEWLPRFGDVYSHAAVIGANLTDVSGDAPGEPAYAAAIFLHRHNYGGGTQPRPTSGCVSLAAPDLVAVLRSLDPELQPHFAIGERTWLASTA